MKLNIFGDKKYTKQFAKIGLVVGFFHNILLLMVQDTDNLLSRFYSWEYSNFCRIFGVGAGEHCGYIFFFEGFIIFPLLFCIAGILIGISVDLIKTKNEK